MTDNFPWLRHYDADVPHSLTYPAIPLHTLLEQAAQRWPERACLLFKGDALSYRAVEHLSTTLARALVALGVQPGQAVGLMLPNIPQFVIAYFAILKAGGVVVALNPNYRQRELETQLAATGARVMITLLGNAQLIDDLNPNLRPINVILTELEDAFLLDDLADGDWLAAGVTRDGTYALRTLLRDYRQHSTDLPRVQPSDAAIFQFSGGTTGTPKAAVGLHRNVLANTLQFRAWLSALRDGEEVFLTAIPLYHVYGMVIGMSVGIAMGATLVLIADPRDLPTLLDSIQLHRATFFPGVPNMYHAINQNPDVQAGKYDLRSIKACISGSAPLLRPIKSTFEALTGGKLVEGYGLSEAPTATHCNPVMGDNRAGSIGLPLPDVEARIVDLEDGKRVLPPNESGELIIRGPQIMAGYHDQPEETALALRDGWLYTGDIARMDADGYFYLVERKKDLIKIGGFSVWPREIEEVLAQHPAVQDVGVAGVPHPERGEMVKAWVVLKSGAETTVEDLHTWCVRNLVGYKAPSEITFRSTPLPRTPVGKLLRRELVREHIEGHE